jgi:NAD(P)-dependent dehydrogenase (short-subunit alcohol dehydrogenase family)
LAAGETIDMLINNAGALFNPRQTTAEGLEKSFALLLLSPYILTERLLPLLQQSGSARVVNVLSGGMYTQKIDVEDLQSQRGAYSGSVAYARAKRGLMIATEEWAARWEDYGITVNAMHPGWADTPGVETALPGFHRVTKRFLRSPEEGADTAVWLATSTEAGEVSGKFWLDREQHPSHLSDRTRETPEERQQLLAHLEDLLGSTGETRVAQDRSQSA